MIKQYVPNALTILRGWLTAVMVFLFFLPITDKYLLILILFVTACLTDFLDGRLARRWQIVASFGKIFDPLFDKVLTISLYFLLVPLFDWQIVVIFILLLLR